MKERQEIHCHNCGKYVQFDIDVSLNGNHVLRCPNCDHEHCRVVRGGVITGDRWDSRNVTMTVTHVTMSTASTWTSYSSSTSATTNTSAYFLYDAWMNAGATT